MKYVLRTQEEIDAFNALCKLGASNGVRVARDGEQNICIVCDSGITFTCADDDFDVFSDEQQKKTVDKEGFSWFKAIRGKGADNERLLGDAEWKDMLTRVPQKFFNDHPCLIYTNKEVIRDKNTEVCKYQIRNLIKNVFGIEADVVEAGSEQRKFYGASLCLKLSASGDPVSLVGRIFFTISNEDKSFRVISKDNASVITDVIAQKENQAGAALSADEIAEWNEDRNFVYDKIKEFLKSGENLFDYLIFGEEDQRIFDDRLGENVQFNGVLAITCSAIDINLIMKVFVNVPTYKVLLRCNTSVKELRAHNFAKLISIDCACGKKLIEYNRVVSDDGGFDVTVDFDRYNQPVFKVHGIALDEARNIAIEKVFSKHLRHVRCNLIHEMGATCEAYICGDCFVEVACADGGSVIKCDDCPYCEVYMKVDGRAYELSMLSFDGKELFVTDEDNKNYCSVCGRTIKPDRTECHLCSRLELSAADDAYRQEYAAQNKLYKRYQNLLPFGKRLTKGKDRRCVEDQEYIVFKSGNLYFVFDKILGEFIVKGDDATTAEKENWEID